MSPAEHLDSVKERLLTDPVIVDFHVRRERLTTSNAHLHQVHDGHAMITRAGIPMDIFTALDII